jgi:hypothetical protein
MKKVFVLLFLVAGVYVALAQQNGPAASPSSTVSCDVGLTKVTINYSRPKMKGRKIFGEGSDYLVPYGKIWRTGANAGTRVSFSDDVKIEGHSIPKGEYLIFTWPGANEWTISLYKDLSIGGYTNRYDKANEVALFKVKPQKLTEKVETFTVGVSDIAEDNTNANIMIAWENTAVKMKVEVPKKW